jgi:hypothetical protein
VFNANNGFAAVWHFSPADTFVDATANHVTGTNTGTVPATGVIGDCREFTAGGYITFSNPACLQIYDSITFTTWVKSATPTDWSACVRHDGHYTPLQLSADGKGGTAVFDNGTAGSTYHFYLTEWNTQFVGAWHHYATVYSSTGGCTIYKDGEQVFTSATAYGRLKTTTNPLIFGANEGGGENYTGLLDEPVFSKGIRSPAWIKLSALNQAIVVDEAPTIAFPQKAVTVKLGTVADITPVITGYVDSITMTPSTLPLYLAFNKQTGAITGLADELMAKTTFIVSVWNVRGHDDDTLTIEVIDPNARISMSSTAGRTGKPGLLQSSCARQPAISFYLPGLANLDGIVFAMYDCRGVKIWQQRLHPGQLRSGIQSLTINSAKKIPAGNYLVQMAVKRGGAAGSMAQTVKMAVVE